MTTTEKLETGYQYICNNNLITNFLNYQMTKEEYRALMISTFYRRARKKTSRGILTLYGIWKISRKLAHGSVCRNTFSI